METNIIKKIENIVGAEHCTTRKEDMHCYSYDGSGKIFLPDMVIFPDSTEQISQVMQVASEYKIPVLPRGAGTGMTGGVVPLQGGIVIAMNRLNRILEIDHDNMIGIVEPGVITGELQHEVKKSGLYYPPDPASLKYCTIGGNAGECAGGPSAVKYGVTKDYIIGLEVVLASGEIINTGTRTEKGVTGYDLTRLFVGCEGTLGIITRLTVRLLPLPQCKETFLVESTSLEAATSMVAKILSDGITPCTLEYMDKTAISVVQSKLSSPLPSSTEALLLIELDGDNDSVKKQTINLKDLFTNENSFTLRHAQDESEVKELWKARRSISPATFNLKPNKISEDVAVPRSRIPELVAFTEKLSKELKLTILTFGHAGDGNIHVNIMLDKSNITEMVNGVKAKDLLFRHAISLGGTLSGEHGIGLSKSPYLGLEIDESSMKAMKSIKTLFDPKNILNPGKIFPAKE